jgi:hypothetical protein
MLAIGAIARSGAALRRGWQINKKAQLNELGFSLSGTGGRTRTATPFGKGF